jgi:hypothetical protein
VLFTHTFLCGKIFDAKLGGRNSNICGWKGLANFEIVKLLIWISIIRIKFHFCWNSVDPIRHSYRAPFGEIRRSGEPIPKRRWHYKIVLFSEAPFIFKFKFTAWVMPSSTYVLFIPLQLSWQPTPFFPLRVALVRVTSRCSSRTEWHVGLVASLSSHRVLCEVRIKWRVVQGLARCLGNKALIKYRPATLF